MFFIAIMGITQANREAITWPEKWIADTVTWTQSIFNAPAAYVAGVFKDIRVMGDIYDENKALKKTLALYAKDVARLNKLEQENERLKEALQFTERQKARDNYIYRIAHVVSRSTDVYNNTIRIDLGSEDGIKENMAVTTDRGLIGRTVRVSSFYSTVELITNLELNEDNVKAISATVQGNETSFGIIQSYDRQKKTLLMTKIRHEDPLKEGDVIITSGLGGVFPKGLVIGTVVSRSAGELGTITHTAEIAPAAEFDPLSLHEVFVVEVPEL